MPSVTVTIKLQNEYAKRLRLEAAARQMKLTDLVTDYAMRGMDAAANDQFGLAALERRVVATLHGMNKNVDAVLAEVDMVGAMLDVFVKLMLVHLPEPGTEREATQASALSRYERYIQQTGAAFDGNRPMALRKIAKLIQRQIDPIQGDGGDSEGENP
ncbi:hypothetical protein HAP99_09760 [Acidithiobacillus caldus]|uniref:hypothetical protein n=1 Tax=Acidithiobacillaceae TaxID=225058 RepID=UPI001C06D418|nr:MULTISPECIES: hypothetical protein [Acidithiobacillaceae]MBU2783455.1 hypothetical protein [Acidithiobacillus caldus]MBU2791512.1 hypothetical protein [Acidithiobacillus caldus]